MRLRHALTFAVLAAGCIAAPLVLQHPVAAAQSVDGWMNDSKQTCTIQPWRKGGFEISFSAHSKVKLNGHGQNTVTLYAQPGFGAAIAGMGVSGETLDKLSCTSNSQGTWCRVGYPGQSGRVLWVHGDALIALDDGG